MFSKILIANRGEIAVRVIRACREMGVRSVAVYSETDRDALHVQLADEAVCIGPARAADSYLNMPSVLSATVLTGAEALHPGFGFLSENAKFARMCGQCNIAFIGPSPTAMEMVGHKLTARLTMMAAGVPVVPGSQGLIEDAGEALALADALGYPVLIKAAAGGGGRGIRRVDKREAFADALHAARTEALSAFGDDSCYIEKLLEQAHHIEFQILCDAHGNALHLFERDCSVQRRRQKLVEEAPSSLLDDDLRRRMGEAALAAAGACGYVGAGTVEFLLDDEGAFYFMEMNARIQVEHPVTEQLTGVDLIKAQILIAAGEDITAYGIAQEALTIRGHAIECRLNAEDPERGFAPSAGKVTVLHMPGGPGVRVDSLLYSGVSVPPYYDSMLAKIIVTAPSRAEAIVRMQRALGEVSIEGVATNADYLLGIISDPAFARGGVHTHWLEER